MKKLLSAILVLFTAVSLSFAQEESSVSPDRMFFVFEEGVSIASVTRIQKVFGRSNFVWQDAMIGGYSTVKTNNFPVHDILFRFQAFYPFQHQFNGMEMFAKQTILYAFDAFTGPYFVWEFNKHVRFNMTPGLHYMYQLSDEYHLNYAGLGTILGTEFPVSEKWTVMLNGSFTYDYANIGSNRNVQPFDYSWQWGASLGIRYSKRIKNN